MMRRLDTCYRNLRLFSVDFDYPNVNSNSTVFQDFVLTQTFPLGTHILTWGFGSDATGIEDMVLQFKFVDVDTMRMTLNNLTGGAIDAGVITPQFVTREFSREESN